MRIRTLPICGLVVILSGGAAFAQSVEWKTVSSAEGRFSALFPGTPAASDIPTSTVAGSLNIHMLSVTEPNGWFFAVSYFDLPPDVIARGTPDEFLNAARDGAVKNVKGKLLSERRISAAGFPGRELKITGPDDLYVVDRVYMVHERQLAAAVAAGNADQGAPEITKFLDSFKFIAPVSDGPASRPTH